MIVYLGKSRHSESIRPPFKNCFSKKCDPRKIGSLKDCRFSAKMSEFTQQFAYVVGNPLLRENDCSY